MITLGEQGGMIFPVGLGIGPTQLGKFTMSPKRAAGKPPVITEEEPLAIMPGAPGIHPGSRQGFVWLVTTAAIRLLISTFGIVAIMMSIGTGGCGIGAGGGGGCGIWQCGASCRTLSVKRAAGGMALVQIDLLALDDHVALRVHLNVGLSGQVHSRV